MGKHQEQSNLQQQQQVRTSHGSSTISIQGCPMGLRRVRQGISLRCVVVLILSFSVLFSSLLWILPSPSRNLGFDAKASVKLSATVQASFNLEKPVKELIPRINRLEYDIYEEIGVPATKVAVLSMHQGGLANLTVVVFGVLSDPPSIPIDPVSLIMLKSYFVGIFLQLSNLTLTTSIFGPTSDFQILKFPGGVSIIPKQSFSIWMIPQILFNFSLNNSISEINSNSVEFREQLKDGLHLQPYENIYVQVRNSKGSTIYPLVTVEASVLSDDGSMLPDRWKELAQTITGFPSLNLGLDHSVFGKVKSVTLSSILKDIESNPPSPSPAPSPGPSHHFDHPPLSNPSPRPHRTPRPVTPPISTSPSPSIAVAAPPQVTGPSPSPYSYRRAPSPVSQPPQASVAPYSGSGSAENLVSPSSAPSPSSSALLLLSWKEFWLLSFSALLIHRLF